MKNYNLIKRLFMDSHEKQSPQRFARYAVMLIMLLILGVGQMWADNGWFDDNTWQIRVWPGSGSDIWKGPYSKKNNDNPSWGVITAGSYYIKGVGLNTWGSGVTSTEFYFSLNGKTYGGTVSTGSSSGNYYWENTNLPNPNVDIVSKAANNPGNNTITCYFKYNSGNQFERTITYTLPGFTTTSTSKTIISALSSNKSETISFGNHYGTALTTGNCSITGTHASQFSVTSISETGVTVRFTPSSAGVKNATLTITDAHSKTCTITLTGKSKVLVTYSKGSASGATGSTVTDDKVYGVDLTLKNSGSFSRTGYTQTAWNTNEAGTGGTNYALQATYSTESALALYPTWTAKTTTVTLKPNGATSGSDQTVTATYDAAMPLVTTASAAIALPSKTGYTLLGYWDATSSGTQYYAYGGTPAALSSYRTWNKEDATKNLYARWQANQYTLTLYKNDGSGTSTSATATYDATITVTAPTRTGYTFTGYWTSASGDGTKIIDTDGHFVNTVVSGYVASGRKWQRTSNTNLYARWTANTYTVTLNKQSGSGGSANVTATYDAAMPSATMPTRTGYNFQGYYGSTGGSGTKYYNANASSAHVWDVANNTTIYAYWTAKQSALTFDYQSSAEGYGADGSISAATATYSAAMPALSGSMPTAANGYAFMGFYDEMGGEGTKYYNADGTSAHDWDKDTESGTTLYAYYKKAEIAELALSATAVPNDGSSITATPTISPTPTGTYHIEWELQYNNGTALPSQPTFTPGVGDAVSFAAPTTSATYRVHATLRLGTVVGSGTILDTRYTTFQVAGEHTVTIKYQDADGRTLRDTTHVLGKPLEWSSDITAPTIVGYKFDHWDAGDGVSIKNGASTVTTSTANPINIKASYAGTLTAVYAKKRVIYFNNTLGWSSVYVYFYKDNTYWSDDKGTGSQTSKYSGSYIDKHGQMTQIAGTNIYYFDAEAAGVNSSYQTVVFVKDEQNNYEWFYSTKAIRRTDYKSTTLPMYVPLTDQTPDTYNSTKYYKKGYWMNYPENTGYTLTIFDKVSGDPAPKTLKSIPFEFTGDYTMPMELNVDLEAGQTYGFKIYRNDGTWYGNDGKMTANTTNWAMETDKNNCGLQTTVAGNYKFSLAYFAVSGTYHYRVGVTFPVAVNDYRIVYTDGATWSKGAHSASWYHPSRVITKNSSATEVKRDTISFFWSYGSTPAIKSQQCTGLSAGNATWNAGTSINVSGYSSVLTKAGVYNFIFEQPKSGGSISLVGVEPYTGSYYIRTDCAGSTKWSNYQSHDHQMTYSDYAAAKSAAASNTGFTHYYAHWVTKNSNVKFVIANDYSPCISDTLVEDYSTVVATIIAEGNADAGKMTSDNASIRFMWNEITNKISRAYISGSTTVSDRFLVLEGDAKMFNKNGQALTTAGGGKVSGLNDNEMNFVDDQNFVYEQTIQVKTTARARLSAKYNGNVQYFIGSSGAWAAGTTVELLGGSASETKHNMRVVYDFKTNRLVTAYIPSGTIEENLPIHADLMIVREHQEAGQQLTFNGGKLTEVETVYGVMRFNRWTLNNKSTAAGHAVLGDPKSSYERGLYWISFPFDVNLGDVFGFGTYGVDWIMMEYDGAERAQKGYWKDSDGFWKYITSRVGKTLEAGKGYVLALDLARMKDDNPEFWTNNIEQVELFFPSAANVGGIEATTAHTTVDEHECTIDRRTDKSVNNINKDRTKADSHWNIIGVPSYANYGTTLYSNEGLSEAISWHSSPYTNDLPFLYEWNTVDNTYTVQSGATYPFKSLHAYMVQYHGDLYWKLASATPASIVARRTYAERPQSTEFRLELQQNEKMVDQTFVKLSNDEEVSANFVFDEDLCKEYNGNKANIYTFIEGYIPAAGNTLPTSEQTTVVPVGVKTVASGDYTFAMPAGTDGVGVTLIDNETGLRTPLGLTDYTVTLEAGTYDERFALEISPIKQTPTGVELLNGENGENGVRKVMIDGILYIVKDGEVFDARGNRVK